MQDNRNLWPIPPISLQDLPIMPKGKGLEENGVRRGGKMTPIFQRVWSGFSLATPRLAFTRNYLTPYLSA
jgi:hypothetical protein